MRILSKSAIAIVCILSILSCTTSRRKTNIDINSKPEGVKRSFKTLSLNNKLQVLLVSDPDLTQSAAALNVNVGFGQDPQGQAGMAHFLEHMLFLGTKKFPDESEYSRYINSHQGFNNAYTTFENTNYYLQINHEGFEGALDRFSQFFIAPLFTPKFVDREKNAVNSEFQKNRQNDNWRLFQLSKLDYKDNHPAKKFGSGNKDTLKTINREALIAWHKKYYVARNMTLTLVSNHSLEMLEKLTRSYFSGIKDASTDVIEYDQDLLKKHRTPSMIHVKPVKNKNELSISFSLPSQRKNAANKSYRLIADLLGSEEPGGLAIKLKNMGLATRLTSSSHQQAFQFGITVDIDLTKKGEKEHLLVLEEVFSYINFIKKTGFPEKLFHEKKTLAEIYFKYPRFQEGGNYAAHLASSMRYYGSKDLRKKMQLYYEKSPKAFNKLMSQLVLPNAQIFYSHNKFKPDSKEPIYGTEYKIEKLPRSLVEKLENKIGEGFKYRSENPYIPENLDLVSSNSTKAIQVISDKNIQAWHQADQTIKLPRAHIVARFVTSLPGSNAKSFLVNELWARLINQILMPWQEKLSLAGISLSIKPSYSGLAFQFDGFSDKIPLALSDLFVKLDKMKFDESLFKNQKFDYLRHLKNIPYSSSYKQVIKMMRSEMNPYHYYSADHISLGSKISLSDIEKHHKSVLSSSSMQLASYGNLDVSKLKSKIHPKLSTTKISLDFMDKAYSPLIIKKKLKIQSKDNNYAWTSVRQIGARNVKSESFMLLLETLLSDRFFNELRTHQQLGYVVAAFPYKDPKKVGIQFLIQSSKYKPGEIRSKVHEWLRSDGPKLKNLQESEFLKIKEALLSRWKKPFKTSSEFANQLFSEVFILKNPGYRKNLITAIEGLTLQNFKKSYSAFINETPIEIEVSANKSK